MKNLKFKALLDMYKAAKALALAALESIDMPNEEVAISITNINSVRQEIAARIKRVTDVIMERVGLKDHIDRFQFKVYVDDIGSQVLICEVLDKEKEKTYLLRHYNFQKPIKLVRRLIPIFDPDNQLFSFSLHWFDPKTKTEVESTVDRYLTKVLSNLLFKQEDNEELKPAEKELLAILQARYQKKLK